VTDPFVIETRDLRKNLVMSAETYFRTGALPWSGLLFSAAVSMALWYGAVVNMARQDF